MSINPIDLFANAPKDAGLATFDDQPLPEGNYPLVIEACEQRKYVDGAKRKPEAIADACSADPMIIPGDEVAITYVITEGKFAKRKLFGNYVLKAASNQRTYGEFTPEKKAAAGLNDLCGLRIRLGTPTAWSDWVGKLFTGYITAKQGKPKPMLGPDGLPMTGTDGKLLLQPAKVFNEVRCTVKPGEENAPAPSAPKDTTPVAKDEPPF